MGAPAEAESLYVRSMELHGATGQRTMEAWSLHMLSTTLLQQQRFDEAVEQSRHAMRHFSEAGDVSGLTLAFDVMSVVALAVGERLRGGRLWGAARQLQRASGTGLAEWDARVYLLMPFSVRRVFACALDERDPFAAA